MSKASSLDLSRPVKKHVSLIHITNTLSLLQRKAFNIFLLNAYDKLLVPGRHSVDLDLFCTAAGFDSKNFAYLEAALSELRQKQIEGDLLNEAWEITGWRSVSLISDLELDFHQRTIAYEIPSKLAAELYNPEIFAYLNLSFQSAFQSKYALALYETCVRFRWVWSTGFIELGTWRKLLGATGSSYDSFKVFNNRVLKPAIAEVNQISDLKISDILFQRQSSRHVSHIKFIFTSEVTKNAIASIANGQTLMQTQRFKLLIEKGMEKPWALYASEKYDDDYIQEKVNYTDKAQAANQIRTSYQKFLYSAIMSNYKDAQVEQQKSLKEKVKQAKTLSLANEAKSTLEAAQAKLSKRENSIRFELFRETQPQALIEQIDAQAFASTKGRIVVPQGWQSKSKAAVTTFLKEYYLQQILPQHCFTPSQESEIRKRLNH